MNKEEFLRKLTASLNGQVSQQVIQENIRYYDQYISDEVRKGNSEETVIADIGDPRLIAKTIVDAAESAGSQSSYGSFQRETVYEDDAGRFKKSSESRNHIRYYDLNKWYWKLLGIVIVVAVLFLVVAVVSGIFALVVPLLGPIFMVLLIMWFIKMFDRR